MSNKAARKKDEVTVGKDSKKDRVRAKTQKPATRRQAKRKVVDEACEKIDVRRMGRGRTASMRWRAGLRNDDACG